MTLDDDFATGFGHKAGWDQCVQDFEDQREKFEAFVYFVSLSAMAVVGLTTRCFVDDNTKQFWRGEIVVEQLSSHNRPAAKGVCKLALAASLFGFVVLPIGMYSLYPQCGCLYESSCDVCTMYMNGNKLGSCYIGAAVFGFVFIAMFGYNAVDAYGKKRKIEEVESGTRTQFDMVFDMVSISTV